MFIEINFSTFRKEKGVRSHSIYLMIITVLRSLLVYSTLRKLIQCTGSNFDLWHFKKTVKNLVYRIFFQIYEEEKNPHFL